MWPFSPASTLWRKFNQIIFWTKKLKVATAARFGKFGEAGIGVFPILQKAAVLQTRRVLLPLALKETGDTRRAKLVRDTIDYHATPVEAAEIARDANVRLLLFTHMVPPLQNALMKRIFMRGVDAARGNGETRIGFDGLMVTLPGGSTAIETADLS